MNGNYEWQRHQAKERSRVRMEDAEKHRLAKHDAQPKEPFVVHAWHIVRSLIRHLSPQRGKEPARAKPKLGVD